MYIIDVYSCYAIQDRLVISNMSIKIRILAALLTSFCISLVISFVMVLVNFGFGPTFLSAWLKGLIIGFVVSIPLSYFLPQLIQDVLQKAGVK